MVKVFTLIFTLIIITLFISGCGQLQTEQGQKSEGESGMGLQTEGQPSQPVQK